MANGIAELPTERSMDEPYQAAPICLRSMPASASASVKASMTNCSAPVSQRSPKRVQPMPMMATLSLIPLAIQFSRQLEGHRFPKISIVMALAVSLLDAKSHCQRRIHVQPSGTDVNDLHQHPGATVKLD